MQDSYVSYAPGVEIYYENGYIFQSFACVVTDPEKCGFSYTVHSWQEADEECNGYWNYVYYFGASTDEETDGDKYEFISYTGKKRHTTISERVVTDTGCVSSTKCSVCGTPTKVETIDNYEYTNVSYEYRVDGSLSSKKEERGSKIFSNYAKGDRIDIIYSVRYEYYDQAGNMTSWIEDRYEYPNASEGNYCYRIVTRYNQNNPDGYFLDEQNHWRGYYWIEEGSCVPGTPEMVQCPWCDEVEIRSDNYYDHNYEWNDELELYVCTRCGLESTTGWSGNVIFADYTVTESTGKLEYIIGYFNYYTADYSWRVSLIVPTADGDYDQIILPDIQPEVVGEYRLYLDAMAIANAAKSYGYKACEYMVRVTFVPTGEENMLDYAITLDPHVFALNAELSNIVENACTEQGTRVYDCVLCGEAAVKEQSYGGAHVLIRFTSYNVSYTEDNNQEFTVTIVQRCKNCGYSYCDEVQTEIWSPDGTYLKKIHNRYDDNGNLSKVSVYDVVDGVSHLSAITYYDVNGNVTKDEKYTFINDGAHLTEKTEYDADGNMVSKYLCEYVVINGRVRESFIRHEDYTNNYWDQNELTYDLEKNVCTYSYTDSNGGSWTEEHPIY